MNKKDFINRRDAIKEGFRVRVDKEGDHLSVETEGDNSQEFFDFARCLFGDNFDSFNCDFDDPMQPEQHTEVEIPEVGFDYEAEDQMVDVDDPFAAFDEPVEEAPVEEPDEEAEEEPEEEIEEEPDEEVEEDHKDEKQPMDMINGKLVPAKDPTASEVEIDDEDEDDDEEDDDDEEELEEDLNVSKYDCYYKDEFVGSVYAMSEDEAYSEMEKVWPELNYGEYDGVANVVLSEDLDEDSEDEDDSEEDFLNALGEALYGKRKDLNEAGLGLKNKIKNFAAGVKRAFTTTKVLDNIVKFQVKELDSDGKVIKTYEAKSLTDAEKLATAASKKSNVDKAQVVAVDYKDQEVAKKYKDESNPMLFIDSTKKKELALKTFRDGKKSDQTGETDVVDTFVQELDAAEQTAKAKTVEATPEKEPEATKEVEPKKEPVETKQPEVQQKDTKGVVLNRKIKRNKAIKAALDKAGFDTSSLVNGKKASDKLNTIRKDLFGEGLQEDYEPKSEEEKALWDKLSDNYCGPDYEYELTYDARNYENSKSVPKVRQTYDGDYVETGAILVGTYYGSFEYYKAPTYEDVLEFLGEDHLTEEGAERFIADDKKKENSEFVEFLTIKYEDEAVDKFQEDLEDGEYDDQMDWEEDWPEPDYDDYDD